jgi:anti-sigma regulatory factor (Ser/Thr protein kinase)
MCWQGDTGLDDRKLRKLRSAIGSHVADIARVEDDVHVVEQIMGELIGNVQRYAPGPFCAEAHWVDDSLQLAVHDPGPCFVPDGVSVTGPADWEAERGRGIAIIKALGGRVVTHREDDKGCRVEVTLAMEKRESADATPPACPHGHPAARGAHCPRITEFLASRAGSPSAEARGTDTANRA